MEFLKRLCFFYSLISLSFIKEGFSRLSEPIDEIIADNESILVKPIEIPSLRQYRELMAKYIDSQSSRTFYDQRGSPQQNETIRKDLYNDYIQRMSLSDYSKKHEGRLYHKDPSPYYTPGETYKEFNPIELERKSDPHYKVTLIT